MIFIPYVKGFLKKTFTTFVAEEDGKIAGVLVGTRFVKREFWYWNVDIFPDRLRSSFYVENIAVLPRYRRKGVAAALLAAARDYAKKSGLRHLMLDASDRNRDALRLFERVGMKTIGSSVVMQARVERLRI